ncbi:YncE family protein [Nevskia soli]|uniref:YncE family protein n=1 Tax=Nevskia soli TaxID=418856 RepID=UPI0015D73156|nr:PQQ-binding-like beta-propeller repeat protein [Nevskia soli]
MPKLYLLTLLLGAASGAAASTAWVGSCCNNPGLLFRYDTASHTLLPLISAGVSNPADAIYSPDGQTIFVASEGPDGGEYLDGEVAVMNASSGDVTATAYFTDGVPFSLVVSPDGSVLYVGVMDVNGALVYALNAQNLQILATSPSVFGDNGNASDPLGRLVVSPDGTVVYLFLSTGLTAFESSTLSISHSLTATLGVGIGGAVSPDGNYIYVPEKQSGGAAVAAVNASTFDTAWTVPILSSGKSAPLAIDPSGDTIYAGASTGSSGILAVIPVSTHRVSTTYTIPGDVRDVAVAADGANVYVLLIQGILASVSVATGAVKEISTNPGITYFESLSPENSDLLIANSDTGVLEGFDPSSGASVGSVLGGAGYSLSTAESINSTYAFQLGENGVLVVDLAAQRYVGTIPVSYANAVAANASGSEVYVLSGYFNATTSEIWAADTAALRGAPKLQLPVNAEDAQLAVSADQSTLFVATQTGFFQIDLATSTVTSMLPGNFASVATSATEPTLVYYVTGAPDNYSLNAMNYSTRALTLSVPLDPYTGLNALRINAKGTFACVLGSTPLVQCVDFALGRIVWTADNGEEGMGIGITPDSKYVVVTVQFGSNAFVYDARDGQLVGMLPLPSPGGVVVTSP